MNRIIVASEDGVCVVWEGGSSSPGRRPGWISGIDLLLSVVRGAQHLHADLGYSLRVDPQEQLDDVPGDALKGHLPACGHAYVRLRGLRRSASSSGVGAMASVPSSASNITRGRLTTEA